MSNEYPYGNHVYMVWLWGNDYDKIIKSNYYGATIFKTTLYYKHSKTSHSIV